MNAERKNQQDRGRSLKHRVDQLLMKDQLEQGLAGNKPSVAQKREKE